MQIVKFRTSSYAGDILAMLAGIKKVCNDTKQKAVIYQVLNVNAGDSSAAHAFSDKEGLPVNMNEYMFGMLKPLLRYQEYIYDYIIYKGQLFDFDLDDARLKIYTGQPTGSVHRWIFRCFPQMACDLTKSWVNPKIIDTDITVKYNRRIIINRTLKFHNYLTDYRFLREYEDECIFVGTAREHEKFTDTFDLDIEHYQPLNFLELSTAFSVARMFIGNQSFCWNLAEAIKIPRILEIFAPSPNVIPFGNHAYDFYHNHEFLHYFDKLYKNS